MTLLSQKYIDDNDIVARYLANQLSDAERESFEAYYLEHPELLQELNRAAKFKSGLIDLHESGALQHIIEAQPWWKREGSLAIAASVVLAAIGLSFWFGWLNESRPILANSVAALTPGLKSTLALAGTYDIQRTRTSSYDATIKIPIDSTAIELRIKPEVVAAPTRYRISLGMVALDSSVKELATTRSLQPGKDGFVTVYLNASKFSPAIYEVKISGDLDTNGIDSASSFLIELVSRDQ